jgi:hypothetical protein
MKSKMRGVGMVRGVEPSLKTGYRKFKSYRKGRKAAKQGLGSSSCPYQLSEEMVKLLVKRDLWMRGWEDFAYSKKGSKARHKRFDKDRRERLEKKRSKNK